MVLIVVASNLPSNEFIKRAVRSSGFIFVLNFTFSTMKNVVAFAADYDLQFQCRITTAWSLAFRQKPAPSIASFDFFVFSVDSKATNFAFDPKKAGDFAKDGIRLKTPPTYETDLWSIEGVRRHLLPSAFWLQIYKCFVPAAPTTFPIILDLAAHVGTALTAAIHAEVGYVGVIQDPDAFARFTGTTEKLILASCDDQQISVWRQNQEKFIKVTPGSPSASAKKRKSAPSKELEEEEDEQEGEEEESLLGASQVLE